MYNKFCPSTIPFTLESSCVSIDSSRWNCDGERERDIPRETKRDRRVHMLESAWRTDRDRNKGFRAFGGNPPKGIFSTISVSSLEISVDGYFKTNIFLRYTYVIGLQRLQKTEKLATEDGYSKKKRNFVRVRHGSIRNSKKKDYQKYTLSVSVEQRHSLRLRDEIRDKITLRSISSRISRDCVN